MEFSLVDPEEEKEFVSLVVEEMTKELHLSREEAVWRVQRWINQSAPLSQIIFHELPEFWAKQIYYSSSSYWWLDEANAIPKD